MKLHFQYWNQIKTPRKSALFIWLRKGEHFKNEPKSKNLLNVRRNLLCCTWWSHAYSRFAFKFQNLKSGSYQLLENDRSDFYRTRTLAENDNIRGISIDACVLGLISLLPLSLWFSLCLLKLYNVALQLLL